jgi:hypothetical protein
MIESNVKITDEEKLNTYVTEKSWFRYNQILDKMLSFKVTLSDVNLHDYYRYDIRLRRLLFKYLTAYEIKLRGKVLNSIKEGFEKVECLSFGQLIDQYYFDQPDLVKVKDLRNLIFHHRMIQLEDECEVIEAINIILKKLKREKFYSELEMLKEDLLLVKAFFITDENIKYDYVRSD